MKSGCRGTRRRASGMRSCRLAGPSICIRLECWRSMSRASKRDSCSSRSTFFSSRKALIPSQQYSPFEMGLSRLVQLEKAPFVGQSALRKESVNGAPRRIVGLEIDWEEVEALYEKLQLPPQVPATASRVPVPVYHQGVQAGKATSTTWSPILKKTDRARDSRMRRAAAAGTRVQMEVTVEAVRHRVGATVTPTPFFNPPRKTARLQGRAEALATSSTSTRVRLPPAIALPAAFTRPE